MTESCPSVVSIVSLPSSIVTSDMNLASGDPVLELASDKSDGLEML